jgi:RHS repeat-associated protein
VEEKQSGNWVTVAEYWYDGLNRRVRKVVTNKGSLNGTTRYIWGGDSNWQCLEERDGSNDLVARFTYSPGYIDAAAVQERDLNSDDDFGDDDEVVYYHGNTLASVYCLTDDGENVVERYRYDAYGGCTVLDADGSDDSDNASDVENPFLFTGRRLDSEWAGMQYRHRSYSTTLGRFISRDPAGDAAGMSLYLYAGCAPNVKGDPTGLFVLYPYRSRRSCFVSPWSLFMVMPEGILTLYYPGGRVGHEARMATCVFLAAIDEQYDSLPGDPWPFVVRHVYFRYKRVSVTLGIAEPVDRATVRRKVPKSLTVLTWTPLLGWLPGFPNVLSASRISWSKIKGEWWWSTTPPAGGSTTAGPLGQVPAQVLTKCAGALPKVPPSL